MGWLHQSSEILHPLAAPFRSCHNLLQPRQPRILRCHMGNLDPWGTSGSHKSASCTSPSGLQAASGPSLFHFLHHSASSKAQHSWCAILQECVHASNLARCCQGSLPSMNCTLSSSTLYHHVPDPWEFMGIWATPVAKGTQSLHLPRATGRALSVSVWRDNVWETFCTMVQRLILTVDSFNVFWWHSEKWAEPSIYPLVYPCLSLRAPVQI